jgi:2-polyprenyl-6-methoxyphenol hydroxylase-like FAD-dependent oxidoreductase
MDTADVVIVGGGIGGAALATALANDGLQVVVLEASEVYEDRVRGESMQPWGVAEARELGLEKTLLDAGAHVSPLWKSYHEGQVADLPIGMVRPEVAGSLNLRHPVACAALAAAATDAGARVHRGVRDSEVMLGNEPIVKWRENGSEHETRARIVVGADGRGSRVRKALGIELERAPVLNHIAGLLVDETGIPPEHDWLAGEGDLFMASFHQDDGRIRVYLCPAPEDAKRWVGPGNVEKFLAETAFGCLPFGEQLACGTPAGPLATYPGDDTWCERPFGEGAVLVGDAAGYSNPIIGQGLGIAMRDARSVRDVLRGDDWSPAAFEEYGNERMERMRRLRFVADTLAITEVEAAGNREARRAKFLELQATDPRVLNGFLAAFGGPETVPEDTFDDEILATIRSA